MLQGGSARVYSTASRWAPVPAVLLLLLLLLLLE